MIFLISSTKRNTTPLLPSDQKPRGRGAFDVRPCRAFDFCQLTLSVSCHVSRLVAAGVVRRGAARLLSIVAALMGMACPVAAAEPLPATLDDAISLLDRELGRSDRYVRERQQAIDSVKALLPGPGKNVSEEMRLLEEIGRRYDAFNVDSAITYFYRANSVALLAGDSVTAQRMAFNRYGRLPLIGVARESVDGFQRIRWEVYPPNRTEFFDVGNRMMMYTAALYPRSPIRDTYILASRQLGDSLMTRLSPDDPLYLLMSAQRAAHDNDYTTLVASLNDIIDSTPLEDNVFARAAAQLGRYYQQRGATSKAAYYYALSSISDVRGATFEGVALLRLGELLYDMGDTGRAFTYINVALERAAASGSKIRAIEAIESLPKVSKAFTSEDRKRFIWLSVLAVGLLVALAVIVAVLLHLRRQMARMKELQRKLADANTAKERNISRFIELASLYAEKLEEFGRLAQRKITTGQIEDLHRMLKSGSVSQSQTKMFCQIFDSAFLHLYPDFVSDVNALLHPDRQVTVDGPMQLNAELRILAFLRLGIDDTSRVARFLGMSLNTVYTYRNRMRARAIDRDHFEAHVMRIGALS